MKLKEQKRIKFEHDVTASVKFSKASANEVSTLKTAHASNDYLKSLLPNVDEDRNPDMYAVSFDAAVANLINANDDGVVTAIAKFVTPSFLYKPINIEHNKSWVVGCILSYGFSSFASGEPIEDIDDENKTPFNICLGGVIWRQVDPYFAEMVEDSGKKSSYYYKKISASWEIGFDEFYIALGSKNLGEATLVTEDAEVSKYLDFLKCEGGSGYTKEGVPVYRVITGDCVAYGIGLTFTPAAPVEGVTIASASPDDTKASFAALVKTITDEISKEKEEIFEKLKEIDKNISQSSKITVKKTVHMKIKDISEINEDYLKEAVAGDLREDVRGLIASALKKADDEFQAKKTEADAATAAKEAEAKELKSQSETLATEVLNLKNELARIKTEQEAQAKLALFESHLAEVKASFELDEKSEAIVKNQIKDLDSEAFKAWKESFATLFSSLAKKEEVDADKVIAKASVPNSGIPNSQGSPTDWKARALAAFKVEVKDNQIVSK